MSAHKSIDKICAVIAALTLVITILFCNGQAFGIGTTAHAIGYENRLFDRSRVHTFDIVIDDWNSFLETCESETYSACMPRYFCRKSASTIEPAIPMQVLPIDR